MKILNTLNFNYNNFGLSKRSFSRFSRKRVTTQYSNLTNEEINAKIKELEMLKAQNLQTYQNIQQPSVWRRISDGILHGLGWSFASRIVDSLFGPRSLNITSSHPDNNPLDTQNSMSNSEGLTDNFSDNFTNDSDSGGQGWSWITEKLFDDE